MKWRSGLAKAILVGFFVVIPAIGVIVLAGWTGVAVIVAGAGVVHVLAWAVDNA